MNGEACWWVQEEGRILAAVGSKGQDGSGACG